MSILPALIEEKSEDSREQFLLDEQISHLLRRAHQRASAIFLSVLGEHQITPTQFFAMARLHEKGQLSQNKLGRFAAMDPATIQGVIRRLHERGMIERIADATDRRRMVLSLSPLGHRTVEELLAGAKRVDSEILGPLSADERTQFMSLVKKVI